MPFKPTEESPLTFPLVWKGRVVAADPFGHFQDALRKILEAMDFRPTISRGRSSRNGNYHTFLVEIILADRDTMSLVISTIQSMNGVKFVL